jgi:galactose oxidase-like protein
MVMRLVLVSVMLIWVGAIPLVVSADQNGTWEPLPPPSGRQDVLSVYDPDHDRMLVFGGNSGTYPAASPFGELWSLDLATWSWHLLLPAAGGPGFRYQSSMVYDSTRHRILLFGGSRQSTGTAVLADVWSLSVAPGSTWQPISTAGTTPTPRASHVAIYDSIHDRLIIYGGQLPGPTGGWDVLNDTWQLTLSGTPTWSLLTPTNAPSLQGASAIYDPVRQRMLVFGGIDEIGVRRNGVWALSLSQPATWQLLLSGVGPTARSGHTAVYDPAHDSMIVFGGWTGYTANDAWALYLSVNTWFQFPIANQMYGRTEHTAIFDPTQNKMVAYGGDWGPDYATNEIWILDPAANGTGAWSKVAGNSASNFVSGPASFFDPVRNRIVAFGGGSSNNDLWSRATLPGASWTRLFPAGTRPPGMSGTFVYDPVRDRAILYGGLPVSTLWSLELVNGEEWVEQNPTGPGPATRIWHSAVYDPAQDRMLIFGGCFGIDGSGARNDVWELRFATNAWNQIVASGTLPTPRSGAAMVLDPRRYRLLLFAGSTSNNTPLNDLWALTLNGTPTWTQLSNGPAAPSPRMRSMAFYDLPLDRMVLFGGDNKNDLWELYGSTGMWSQLSPTGAVPIIRYGAVGVYDANQRDFYTGLGNLSGECVWALHLGLATTGIQNGSPSPVFHVTASPNPFRGATTLGFSLKEDSLVELTIHDLGGRRVATPLPPRVLSAGPHEVNWRPTGFASGIYFFRLHTGPETQAGRIVMLQ